MVFHTFNCRVAISTILLLGMLVNSDSGNAATQRGSWGVNAHTFGHGQALKDLGTQWVRLSIGWTGVESGKKGRYDWSKYDSAVDQYEKLGLGMVVALTAESLNPLYAEQTGNKRAIVQAIANWMSATAYHFRNKQIVWEIGNEPEVFPMNGFWTDARLYSELAALAAKQIKQVDRTSKVAALSLAWMDRGYASTALKAGMLDSGNIDYLSFHGYHRRDIQPESGLADDVQWLRAQAAASSPKGTAPPQIIDTETGYGLMAYGTAKSANSWRINVYSEETQAAYLARHFIEEIYLGIPISIWYKDMNGENGFSLYYSDERGEKGLRPMGRVFQSLSSLLPNDPASLRNDRFIVTTSLDTSSSTNLAAKGNVASIMIRSYIRRDNDSNESLVIAAWNTIEAFGGKVLSKRTFSGSQVTEQWRNASKSDPIDTPILVKIAGLPRSEIESARVVELPDGGSRTITPIAAPNAGALPEGTTVFRLTASPMPSLIIVALGTAPRPPTGVQISE